MFFFFDVLNTNKIIFLHKLHLVSILISICFFIIFFYRIEKEKKKQKKEVKVEKPSSAKKRKSLPDDFEDEIPKVGINLLTGSFLCTYTKNV